MEEKLSFRGTMEPFEDSLESLRQDYAQMRGVYAAAIREINARLETLNNEFSYRNRHNPIHHIESRVKSMPSIIKKLRTIGAPISMSSAKKHLHDIAGVRVVCRYVDDIYRIADLLQRQRDVEFVHRRDYIENPKESGYRSLHLVIRIPVFLSSHTELVPVEVQIRTIAMDFWASLEHQLRYKSNHETTQQLRRRLQHCAEASAALDREMQDIYREINGCASDAPCVVQPIQPDDAASN